MLVGKLYNNSSLSHGVTAARQENQFIKYSVFHVAINPSQHHLFTQRYVQRLVPGGSGDNQAAEANRACKWNRKRSPLYQRNSCLQASRRTPLKRHEETEK